MSMCASIPPSICCSQPTNPGCILHDIRRTKDHTSVLANTLQRNQHNVAARSQLPLSAAAGAACATQLQGFTIIGSLTKP